MSTTPDPSNFENISKASRDRRYAFYQESSVVIPPWRNDEGIWLGLEHFRNTAATMAVVPSLPEFSPEDIDVKKWSSFYPPDKELLICRSDLSRSTEWVIRKTRGAFIGDFGKIKSEYKFVAKAMEKEYLLDPGHRINWIFQGFGTALYDLIRSAFMDREDQGLIIRVETLQHSLRNIVKLLAMKWDTFPGGEIFRKQMKPDYNGCPVREWDPVEGQNVADIVSNIWIDICMKFLAQVEYRQHQIEEAGVKIRG